VRLEKEFQQVALGECCEIVSGSTPSRVIGAYWNGDINWFTPKDLSKIKSKYVTDAPEKITQLGLTSCSTRLLPKKSLLLSSRAPIGHLAINAQEACTNQGFKSLIPSADLDVEYLYYAIKNIVPQLQDMGNGATFKEISKTILSKVKIPLPSLAAQQKIAAILDAADSLRQKDQQLVERYTTLSQSLFLEMFGDPEKSPFEKDTLQNLFSKGEYGAGATAIEYNPDTPRYIRITDIDDEGHLKEKRVSADISNKDAAKYKLRDGDLVFARSGATVGKTYLYNQNDGDLIYAGYLIKFSIKKPFEGKYFFYFTKTQYYKKWIDKIQTVVAQPNINAKQYGQDLLIPIPPINLQNQFAESIQLIEAQKQQAQASLQKSEALFNSLLQQAFTGSLTAKIAA